MMKYLDKVAVLKCNLLHNNNNMAVKTTANSHNHITIQTSSSSHSHSTTICLIRKHQLKSQMLLEETSSLIFSEDRTTVKVVKINSKLIVTKNRRFPTRLARNNKPRNNSLKETNFRSLKSIVFLKRSHKFCGHRLKVTNTTLQRPMEEETKT